MTDKTAPARQARLKARNAERGLVKVSVWVPEEKRSTVLRMAQEWRKQYSEMRERLEKDLARLGVIVLQPISREEAEKRWPKTRD